jgi:hypothetical protein
LTVKRDTKMNHTITLPNGQIMNWEEFSELPESEQSKLMKSIQKKTINPDGLPTKTEIIPRIRAAAERKAISEEDLLTFIKIVHDVFFPPLPIEITKDGNLPGKVIRKNVNGAFVKLSKPVITPAGEFPSLAAAGRYYQVEGSHIRNWIKSNNPNKAGFKYKNS